MNFQQIRDFVNPQINQAMGLQEVDDLQMPVPVAHIVQDLVIDGQLSDTSINPVQNKVVKAAIDDITVQFEGGIAEAVDAWLDDHPEATTTVQDGAITSAKLDSNLKEILCLPIDVELEYDSYLVPKRGGGFYNSSAEIWKATDYISTAGILQIYYQGISQGYGDVVVPIAFYDSNKNFILAAPSSASGMHIESGIIDVPANAAYFKQTRYINPNDHEIPNSNNYTKYVYISAFNKVKTVLTVGNNKEYASVSEAVNAAKAGDIIYIYNGVYEERVVNRDKPISIIGESVEGVIIQYPNDDYSRPPLEMAKGVIKNITLHAMAVSGVDPAAYALHCDFQGSGVIGGYLHCENVKFINDNYRAVGLGLRGNAHIEFVNCVFYSASASEALYMHDANDTAYDISNQSVSFKNCTFHNNSSTKHTIEVVTQERQIGVAHVEWQRNIVVNDSTGGTLAMTHYEDRDLETDNWMGSSDWVLDTTSALNTESDMNYSNS